MYVTVLKYKYIVIILLNIKHNFLLWHVNNVKLQLCQLETSVYTIVFWKFMAYSSYNTWSSNSTYPSTQPTVGPVDELPVCNQTIKSINDSTSAFNKYSALWAPYVSPTHTCLTKEGVQVYFFLYLSSLTLYAKTLCWDKLVIQPISSRSINRSCTLFILWQHMQTLYSTWHWYMFRATIPVHLS